MTNLEEVARSLRKEYAGMSCNCVSLLHSVMKNDYVKRFFVESSGLVGDPIEISDLSTHIDKALQQVAFGAFRRGLFVGLMLWKQEEEKKKGNETEWYTDEKNELRESVHAKEEREERKERVYGRCEGCDTLGELCGRCGRGKFDCECALGDYSRVKCHLCDGEGYVSEE